MSRVLLVPDAHVGEKQNLSRFKALGNLVVDKRPDAIFSMGDFMAMKSICHWDDTKRLTMEGRRYKGEMETGKKALDYLEAPILELQERQRAVKTKIYKPAKFFLEGNHEFWLHKYIEQSPQMQGHLDIDKDLDLSIRGWEITPYKRYLEYDGVLFTHVPMTGDPNQPIRGNPICATASRYVGKSCVFGHTHRFESMNFSRVGLSDINILTCGSFFDADDDEFGSNIWRGVTILNIYKKGNFDIEEQVSLERLMREYV